MTLFSLIALVAAATLSVAQPVVDRSEWIGFGIDPSGNDVSVALGSLVTNAGLVRFEARLISPRPADDRQTAALFEFELDCRGGTIRVHSVASMTPEGILRNLRQTNEPAAAIEPDSNGSWLRRIVCPAR